MLFFHVLPRSSNRIWKLSGSPRCGFLQHWKINTMVSCKIHIDHSYLRGLKWSYRKFSLKPTGESDDDDDDERYLAEHTKIYYHYIYISTLVDQRDQQHILCASTCINMHQHASTCINMHQHASTTSTTCSCLASLLFVLFNGVWRLQNWLEQIWTVSRAAHWFSSTVKLRTEKFMFWPTPAE